MARGTPAPATGLSLQVSSIDLDDSTEVSPSYNEGSSSPSSLEQEQQTQPSESYFPHVPIRGSPSDYVHMNENDVASHLVSSVVYPPQDGGVAIVRKIASYLSVSDAESIASLGGRRGTLSQEQLPTSWSIGDMQGAMGQPLMSWSSMITTPPTPGLMLLSPAGELPEEERHLGTPSCPDLVGLQDEDEDSEDDESVMRRLQLQQKRWIQQKLTSFVFAHPGSLRSYCLEAHEAARNIHKQRKEIQEQQATAKQDSEVDPETLREPTEPPSRSSTRMAEGGRVVRKRKRRRREREQRLRILKILIDTLLRNVPLSVMIDVVEGLTDLALDTSFAVFRIQCTSVNAVVSALSLVVHKIWDGILNFNPFAVIEATVSMQFNAVGKTSEALVSGIQSVATGVGSASTAALQRLSRGGAGHHTASTRSASSSALLASSGKDSGVFGKMGLRRNRQSEIAMNKKLLRKLSTVNSAAEVISYQEREEERIISKHAKKRVQRMMHYDVSLRPFVATVIVPPSEHDSVKRPPRHESFGNVDFPSRSNEMPKSNVKEEIAPGPPPASGSASPLESHFMCTPSSFPPSPAKRRMVLEMGTKFVEDVVFLARDQLRVRDGLESENERTRAMAQALRDENRLAVFTREEGSGISLSCGQHVATKVGNVLYCSTRSMVPVLRNCFVYFEMSVMTPPVGNVILQASLATLSIGLSTLEMPLNTLVGAWKGSVGLCTTGQILTAGNWCSPLDLSRSSYGDNSTVGCLVYLDDESAFETWDGVMITAAITFNVNGTVVSPPLFSTPIGGAISGATPRADVAAASMGTQHLPHQMPGPVSTLPLLVPMEEELFPTLTLHSASTQVMCRFSAEDILATSPEGIGAPRGATVYAVDGSVLFEDDEDDESSETVYSEDSD